MDLPPVILAVAILLAIATVPSLFQSPAERYKDKNPTVVVHDTEAEARQAAIDDSKALGGKFYQCGGTGSMEPLIVGKAYTVAVPKPYEQIQQGDVANYKPKWANGGIVVHRMVQKDGDGWIASGDSNPRSESWERVRPDNYLDVVKTIHTYKGVEETRVKK